MIKRLKNFITSFELIIGFSLTLMIAACVGAGYGIYIKEIPLTISSLSVVVASISSVVAARVLKSQKDKERPYVTFVINYDRYSIMQIGVKNVGNTLAILESVQAENNLKLMEGQSLFELIKGLPVQPNEEVLYPLAGLVELSEEKLSQYTTSGTVKYKDMTGKTYENKFYISLEQIGATLMHTNEQLKRDYKLQEIPDALKKIAKSLDKME
ncbi:hypothetical protein CN273_22120 [Bacillus thuringiensis]|uniref:hypothetical protein n=1 Tax=Bacillus thuringiensis TaxID=1428 RepID=UPI000BEE5187|nr:hypothetical protein [Bacillus thuringiensis]PDY29988.1 hypothetical protein COM84_09690 [Bacillus thuringiensis]PEF12964.1 hypothetical protein CON23_08550 [Bacillus thuringiensis]PEV91635.1 hypothetical protein CN442_09670 [Bacillus thuringiensis]PFB80040.1 hypothetical protein CN273_22120 [Bacillus thuringiensis]